jgi:tetratricopeptide (TPR) repeat protein
MKLIGENVLVTFHRDTPEGEKMIEKMDAWVYPTFVILDSRNREIASWEDFTTADAFVETVNYALADPLPLKDRKARFKRMPTCADAVRLAGSMLTKREFKEAYRYFSDAMDLSPEAARSASVPRRRLFTVYRGADNEDFSVSDAVVATTELLSDPLVDPGDAIWVGNRLFGMTDALGERTAHALLSLVLRIVEPVTDPLHLDQIAFFRVRYALNVDQDVEKALALRLGFNPTGWRNDPVELNSFAWLCFEIEANLEEAEALAARAVQINLVRQANALDTQAELNFSLGNRERAVELIEQSIALMPDRPYYQAQLQKFKGE